jgi:hypothetical protein
MKLLSTRCLRLLLAIHTFASTHAATVACECTTPKRRSGQTGSAGSTVAGCKVMAKSARSSSAAIPKSCGPPTVDIFPSPRKRISSGGCAAFFSISLTRFVRLATVFSPGRFRVRAIRDFDPLFKATPHCASDRRAVYGQAAPRVYPSESSTPRSSPRRTWRIRLIVSSLTK